MKAVVMCGGIGSRMRPLTEKTPKPMLKVVNIPVIDRILHKLTEDGFTDIYLTLGYKADDIEAYVSAGSYGADIKFCRETVPLGTAGSVKNCLNDDPDDFLVLSGDNIFDFDLKRLKDEHYSLEACVSIVGTNAEDPRDYGVIIKDDDGTVCHFSEKPDWENVRSFLINTGIYFCNREILELIPDGHFFDFAKDLFPLLFVENKKIACISAKGVWYDIGSINEYINTNAFLLREPENSTDVSGEYYASEYTDANDNKIIAPCFIGRDVIFNGGVTIGPFCCIGDRSVFGKNCTVTESVIGEDCYIGSNTDIIHAVIDDNVTVHENVLIDIGAVVGFGADIGRFSRIFPETKISTGIRILPESLTSGEIKDIKEVSADFEIYGMTGKLYSEITLQDVLKIGQAIASAGCCRIGAACDGSGAAGICKSICLSGAMACGADCFDFETAYRSQIIFYSDHCMLDAFIFIVCRDDRVSFYYSGKNGFPFNGDNRRRISDNYKYGTFRYADFRREGKFYRMELFSSVYKSKLRKVFSVFRENIELSVESGNEYLSELVNSVLVYGEGREYFDRILFITDADANEAYFAEDDKVFYISALHVFLCEYEFMRGHDVAIPEDAPELIEEKALKYGRKVYRISADMTEYPDKALLLNDLWAFDSVFLAFRVCEMISQTKMKLSDMLTDIEPVIVRKKVCEFDCSPAVLHKCMEECFGTRQENSIYYRVSAKEGTAKIRQLGNSNKIRILSEATEMETASELSAQIIDKISERIIDIGDKIE